MLYRFEQFTTLISAIYQNIQKIERDEMEKQGLKGAYAQYLLALQQHPQGLTAAQLSELCEKDKAAVSRAVTELENRGLLIRSAQSSGAYRASLTLTETGLQAAKFVSARAAAAVEQAGKGLSNQDRQVFYAALGRIAANRAFARKRDESKAVTAMYDLAERMDAEQAEDIYQQMPAQAQANVVTQQQAAQVSC